MKYCWLIVLVWASGAFGAVFPPHQFRVTDPRGSVFVVGADRTKRRVEGRATLEVKEFLQTEKASSATIRIAGIGNIYLGEETVVRVTQVDPDGRPHFQIGAGQIFLKSMKIGSEKPFSVRFASNELEMVDGMLELRYLGKKKMGFFSPIGAVGKVKTGSKDFDIPANKLTAVNAAGKYRTKGLNKASIRDRWDRVSPRILKEDVQPVPDEVPPQVQISEPADASKVTKSIIRIRGTVDDPGISSVRISVDDKFRKLADVRSGEFATDLNLWATAQEISVEARDAEGQIGRAKVRVRTSQPGVVKTSRPKGPKTWKDRVKDAWENPKDNPETIAAIFVASFVAFLLVFFLLRLILRKMRGGAETAAGLATGVIFNRCEKCGDREYEYHLFYTTEPVTSPFMRNLINNVNPMATSIMNESLENLLNTGLQGSAAAKAAEQKIRVTCTWCDPCKVGNLKLEHMQGKDTVKTDDYQIIHPIFIEWVRKVYD